MSRAWFLKKLDWMILGTAGSVIALDSVLPSALTGNIDEALLGGLVALMRMTRRWWQ